MVTYQLGQHCKTQYGDMDSLIKSVVLLLGLPFVSPYKYGSMRDLSIRGQDMTSSHA